MAFRKFLKKAGKRVYKKAKRFVKKRYGGAKGASRIVKDVAMLKHLVNVEKKRIDILASSLLLGQVFNSTNGFVAQDVTPIPTQGVGFNQRNGASIKIVSGFLKWQFWSQVGINHGTKFRIELWQIKGNTVVPSSELQELYNTNPSNALYDYNSMRNPDYYGGSRKICTKFVSMPPPQITNQLQIKDVQIPLRLDHHVRFDQNTNTVVGGQIIMFIFADSGNSGSTLSSITNIPTALPVTGLVYNQNIKWYFTDN